MIRKKIAEAYVDILGRLDKFKAQLTRARALLNTAMSSLARWAKRGAMAIGIGLAAGIAFATRAAIKQETAESRLAAALKTTGFAAGFTLEQLKKYAAQLQSITTFGDEAIINMQALLATFKNISGDEFLRATKAILDMSDAMGQDMKQSAIQVGKALNDPIIGASMLRRVGVALTEQQMELIRAFQKSGQLAKAQAVILDELEGEFGGMSERIDTTSGSLKQMWNTIGDAGEKIAKNLLPAITNLAKAVAEWIKLNEKLIAQKLGSIFENWGKEGSDSADRITDALESISYATLPLRNALNVVKMLLLGFVEIAVILGETFAGLMSWLLKISAWGKRWIPGFKQIGEWGDSFEDAAIEMEGWAQSIGKRIEDLGKNGFKTRDDIEKAFADIRAEMKKTKDEAEGLPDALDPNKQRGGKSSSTTLPPIASPTALRLVEEGLVAKEDLPAPEDFLGEVKDGVTDVDFEKYNAALLTLLQNKADVYKQMEGYDEAYQQTLEAINRLEAAEYERLLNGKVNQDEIYYAMKKKREQEATDTVKTTRRERLQVLADMFRSMKGYEQAYAIVQQALWREQAKEYAKTGLMSMEEAYAAIRAKHADELKVEAVDRAQVELRGFENAWDNMVQAIGGEGLDKEQLSQQKETVNQLKGINSGVGTLIQTVKNNEGGYGP